MAFNHFRSLHHCKKLPQKCEKRGIFLIAHFGRQADEGFTPLLSMPEDSQNELKKLVISGLDKRRAWFIIRLNITNLLSHVVD